MGSVQVGEVAGSNRVEQWQPKEQTHPSTPKRMLWRTPMEFFSFFFFPALNFYDMRFSSLPPFLGFSLFYCQDTTHVCVATKKKKKKENGGQSRRMLKDQ